MPEVDRPDFWIARNVAADLMRCVQRVRDVALREMGDRPPDATNDLMELQADGNWKTVLRFCDSPAAQVCLIEGNRVRTLHLHVQALGDAIADAAPLIRPVLPWLERARAALTLSPASIGNLFGPTLHHCAIDFAIAAWNAVLQEIESEIWLRDSEAPDAVGSQPFSLSTDVLCVDDTSASFRFGPTAWLPAVRSLVGELPELNVGAFTTSLALECSAALKEIERIDNARREDQPEADVRGRVDDDGFFFSADLAERFGVPREALRRRLERWRRTNDSGWKQDGERGPRDPSFMYQLGAVRHIIDDLAKKHSSSGMRPPGKNL